jgi:hypothetical protein
VRTGAAKAAAFVRVSFQYLQFFRVRVCVFQIQHKSHKHRTPRELKGIFLYPRQCLLLPRVVKRAVVSCLSEHTATARCLFRICIYLSYLHRDFRCLLLPIHGWLLFKLARIARYRENNKHVPLSIARQSHDKKENFGGGSNFVLLAAAVLT